MQGLLKDLDRLLRGDDASSDGTRDGAPAGPIAAGSLVRAALVLGVTYGLFMGLYAATRDQSPTAAQIAVSAVKVPLLFLLTLVVTFPSLYVFSALANSPLRGADTLRLLLAAITVNLALLASFGPVTGFFTLSTDSYPFMVLLNVVFFSISGIVGLTVLRRTLTRVFDRAEHEEDAALREAAARASALEAAERESAVSTVERQPPPAPVAAPESRLATSPPPRPAALSPVHRAPDPRFTSDRARSALRIFRVWIVIYGVVGVQMAWILRPFIGSPAKEFEFFRDRESNFFAGVAGALRRLLE